MIVSASRRTDIPRFYFDWFLNRIKDGYALVRNPMNFNQVSRVPLAPDVVDCIVFWTKNPAPMMGRLDELSGYPYYVQFTINPYGSEMECALPPKKELFDTFHRLADRIGPERAVWRFSPVLLNETYTEEKQLAFFEHAAVTLRGYTKQCKLSFLDLYAKIRKQMRVMGVLENAEEINVRLAKEFAVIGKENGIEVAACGNLDIAAAGIPTAKCIDGELISKITGYRYNFKKDPGQRTDCYCAKSVDIGAYDTCGNGCRYCYANASALAVRRNMREYDVHSPMLCGILMPGDKVTERKTKSDREGQLTLF